MTFYHWKLNGLTAHDNIKISLLQAYATQHICDTMCLSETFLDSSIQNDDGGVKIDGYNLIKSDHPSDSKKGGICIYYIILYCIYIILYYVILYYIILYCIYYFMIFGPEAIA